MVTDLHAFLKKNKKEAAEVEYAPTKAFVDEKGHALKWKFKAITSEQFDEITEKCTREIPIPGKRGQYKRNVDANLLNRRMICECTVFPDLQNAELQDSYGVKTPEELLQQLVSNPGEYADLLAFVSRLCGFDTSLEDKVDQAKN